MGILIQFPQPGTRIPPEKRPSGQNKAQETRLAAAYRRDLNRAVSILLEHIQTDAYDGLALALKPKSHVHKPALVVGGLYRHRLTEAADATMQLHLAIKLRAREQGSGSLPRDSCHSPKHPPSHQESELDQPMQQATLKENWNHATTRYYRCEHMLRIAFSKQLRASPETTAILLSITELHIETVANCLWELVRRPEQATPQAKHETLNAIQQFRAVRAKVSAWMPPADQEATYFAANLEALSEDMLHESDALLRDVESALNKIVNRLHGESVGT